ncbi:phosphoribosylanthranilate isomerase [Natrialba aegyptia]|uniref:N-(5'-phosphoribosyl)anthranilate isomerase n=1 Tax=Natrialba aegyptia DSM 13077 TaxID=1227491 RepID=M0AX44_9EURY|nr:phosphoribosylanthranilate isomerase [Natrialba aegyptia]ELZ03060.1 phosphoribosylanthranilate isomerase [Natrialba aegyptia DSM 13077]
MTRVKICGLTNAADIETAIDAGTDAVGVICDVPVDTPREVAADRARELVAAVPPFVTAVLVTMPETPAAAIDLVERVEPDAVQVHGSLEPTELGSLHETIDADLIAAVDAGEMDASLVGEYAEAVDALIVDSAGEDGGGGTGETHDWDRTRTVTNALETPVILAGGLTPENVADAVRAVDPFAVDVASGVETAGGSKDTDAVRSFVDRARHAEQTTGLQP